MAKLLTAQHHCTPSILHPYLRGWKPENHTAQGPLLPLFPLEFTKERHSSELWHEKEADVFLIASLTVEAPSCFLCESSDASPENFPVAE